MSYYGFYTRESFILKQANLSPSLSLLEIGPGLGLFAELTKEKVKKYCGVDISKKLIAFLSLKYKNLKSISWICIDVCREDFLKEQFDFVISADTLEHVECPAEFFKFISRHLANNGSAIIIFPNESEERHHGITWFKNKEDLVLAIEGAGLKVAEFMESKETFWHCALKNIFWEIPKRLIFKKKNAPQIFEETDAFRLVESKGVGVKIISCYAKLLTRIALFFPCYKLKEIKGGIRDKNIFIKLKKD
jgi:2-polyprenyl-3-methyl-5-hydroxy-6-metoxy-1,4-benzoquinol methylase